MRILSAPDKVDYKLGQAAPNDDSLDTSRLFAQFPAPPIIVSPADSPGRSPSLPQQNPNPDALAPNAHFTSLIAPGDYNAPAYPSSSLRARANEDLNRFVSSSTASGATLGTTSTTGSFVKHAGPAQLRRITPEDVPTLPERVGRMVFDKTTMRWVKTTVSNARPSGYTSEGGYSASVDTEGESEDPFQDIESLREDDTTNRNGFGPPYDKEAQDVVAAETSRIEEIDDDEEADLTSFSFDGPSQGVVHIMTGEEGSMEGIVIEDDVTTDEDYDDEEVTQLTAMSAAMSIDDQHEHDDSQDQTWDDEQETEQQSFIHAPRPVPMGRGPHLDTPLPPRPASAAPTPIRSALKSTSITPLPMSRNPPPHLSYQTPANHAHYRRRSVSFSDGKREGQIAGLGRGDPEEDADPPELDGVEEHGASLAPSVRSKRIAEMMGHLAEDSELRLYFPNLIVFKFLVLQVSLAQRPTPRVLSMSTLCFNLSLRADLVTD